MLYIVLIVLLSLSMFIILYQYKIIKQNKVEIVLLKEIIERR